MARTAFGDAFSRSFDSVVASYRRERESEQAEERLNRRMDRQREQDALDAASEQGIYLPEHLNPGGGYNIQTLKAETAKSKKLGLEAQQDAIWEKTKLREQAERDRIEGEARMEAASEMAELHPDVAFNFDSPNWRNQIKAHKEMVDFQKRQAISGTTPTPFAQQWYNERTGVYSKEKPPVTLGGPLETGIDLSPEPDKFRTSFEPGRVTPEMEGGLAAFLKEEARKDKKRERTDASDFVAEEQAKEADSILKNFTPSQLAEFSAGTDSETPTPDYTVNPREFSQRVRQAVEIDKRQQEQLDEEGRVNIRYFNDNAGLIPSDSGFIVDRNPKTGRLDPLQIVEMKQRLIPTTDSFGVKRYKWFYGPLVVPPPGGGDSGAAVSPAGVGAGVRVAPPVGLGGRGQAEDEGTGEGYTRVGSVEPIVGPARSPVPASNAISTEAFWKERGVSKKTFDVADEIFSSLDTEGTRFIQSKHTPLTPMAAPWKIEDVNPKHESLFDASMTRLVNEGFRLAERVEATRYQSQSLKDKLSGSSAKESFALEKRIADLKASEVADIKEQMRLRKLRIRLTESLK